MVCSDGSVVLTEIRNGRCTRVAADGTVPEDARAQADLCFANIAAILAEAGMSLSDIVRINAYVTEYVGGILMDEYGITLNQIPLTDTVEDIYPHVEKPTYPSAPNRARQLVGDALLKLQSRLAASRENS